MSLYRSLSFYIYNVHACSVTQLYPILCNLMDCNPPVYSVHGIFQAIILEWVAISFSRGSSWPRDQTRVSSTGRQILYHWATCIHEIYYRSQLMLWRLRSYMVCHLEDQEGHGCNSVKGWRPVTPRVRAADARNRSPDISEGSRRWMSQLKKREIICPFLALLFSSDLS